MDKKRHLAYTKTYSADNTASIQQKWLISVLNRTGNNLTSLSKKLNVTRQAFSTYMTDRCKMPYPVICAICYVTGISDDAYKVFLLITKDREKKGEKA